MPGGGRLSRQVLLYNTHAHQTPLVGTLAMDQCCTIEPLLKPTYNLFCHKDDKRTEGIPHDRVSEFHNFVLPG